MNDNCEWRFGLPLSGGEYTVGTFIEAPFFKIIKNNFMTKKKLADFKAKYDAFMAAYKAKSNRKTAIYNCPNCFKDIETIRPTRDQVRCIGGFWDGAKGCPECGEVSWVRVWPSGKTEVVDMSHPVEVIPSNI